MDTETEVDNDNVDNESFKFGIRLQGPAKKGGEVPIARIKVEIVGPN
jgi:hypothetical protein